MAGLGSFVHENDKGTRKRMIKDRKDIRANEGKVEEEKKGYERSASLAVLASSVLFLAFFTQP